MSLNIGVATEYVWLGSPGRDFFEKHLAGHFDGSDGLARLSLRQLKSSLSLYEQSAPDPENLRTARNFTYRMEAHYKEWGYTDDDARTVALG